MAKSNTIKLGTFDGGTAEDIRTHQTNECEDSLNFDIYTNPHRLTPFRDSADETIDTGTMNEIQLTDVGVSTVSGNTYLTAVGYESGVSTKPAFYIRTSGVLNGSWSQQAVGAGVFQQGTMVTYKGDAYAMSTNGALQKYVGAGSLTTVGTASGTGSSPRPFIHPEDNVMYIVWGNVISRWDGSAFTNTPTILPNNMICTSLTDYGTYLAIAMKPSNGIGNSFTYLWGRDTTLNTLQGVVDFGDGALNVIENLGNILVGLVYPKGIYNSTINNKLDIKTYSGGAVETVKSILLTDTNFNTLKFKKDSKLYFGMGFQATNIWNVYKNKSGYWTVAKERYLYNGSTSVGDTIAQVTGINFIGDYSFIAFIDNSGNRRLRATNVSNNFTSTSIYKTSTNPSMPLEDREKQAKLEAVSISYVGKANGTVALKYSFGGLPMTSIVAENTTAKTETKEATNELDGTVLSEGTDIKFQIESTGGVEILDIAYRYSIPNSIL